MLGWIDLNNNWKNLVKDILNLNREPTKEELKSFFYLKKLDCEDIILESLEPIK
jgi:hypothetical protein